MPFAALLLLLVQTDSTHLVGSAHRAQAHFERVRLTLLPRGVSRSGDRCDVIVGRYCYWSDGGRDEMPPEPAGIAAARDRLLAVLDSAATGAPGDGWLVGQRVRYLLEAGRAAAALGAADGCGAVRWWCFALAGLARHAAGDETVAARLYRAALEAMPVAERCRWTDLSDLLDAVLRRRYRNLPCDARAAFNARVWWLAQPLWSQGANDRRTEHYARMTMARLWEDARSLYGFWGRDQRELLVRYGWPVAWEREEGSGVREPLAIGHEASPSYHFVPEAAAFDGTDDGDGTTTLTAKTAAERYAPGYASFASLRAEVATFRRGDSTVVVASYDVAGDTLFADSARRAALVLARDPATPPVIAEREDAPPRGVLVARAAWRGGRVSVEMVAPERRAAGRTRRRLAPPEAGAVALSGIALFDPRDTLPRDLGEVLRRPHTGPIEPGGRVGLYWEAYGLLAGANVSMTVQVTRRGTGWLRRVAGVLHLAARPRAVRIAWHEVVHPDKGRVSRALVLDLGGLERGRYRVEVRVMGPPGGTATTTRTLRLAEP